MPMFEFRCAACKHLFTRIVWKSSSGDISCPSCGSNDVIKQISGFASPGSQKSDSSHACGSS